MTFHRILWTNGTILDLENDKPYDWLMTRGKEIFAMGYDEDEVEEYDAVFDLEGNILMPAFIETYGSFSKKVFSYLEAHLSQYKSFEGINQLKNIPEPSDKNLVDAIMKTQEDYFSQGITMAQEAELSKELIFLYKMILDKLDFDIDIVYYVKDDDIERVLRALVDTEDGYNKNLKYGGINLSLEDNKTASKELDQFIIESLFDQELYDGLKLVSDFKVSPFVSINSHSGITQFINTIEKLKSIGFDLSEYRPILISSQQLDNKQIQKMKDLNIVFSSVIHQDTEKIGATILETIGFEVNQQSNIEQDKKLSVRGALAAVTKNAAYQYQEEGIRGKLERSLQADFVILSENPLEVESDKIKEIKVLKTVVKSKVVWSKQ